VTSSSASTRTSNRVANFNGGPAALPLAVLERIREELTDYRGTGMSVMEMSHRSKEFEEIVAHAEEKLRQLMGISEDYGVIFMQGGGSAQFTIAPMNLCIEGKPVEVLHTGMWTGKAITELKRGVPYRLAASTEAEKFSRVPRPDEIQVSGNGSYVYMCTNNTIEGSQWSSMPKTGNTPLVADMSSDILSRPVDVNHFGMIFAGAQKNLGPSGATVVIVRKDLAERADKNLPTVFQYRTHIKEKSLYHTPPTFAIYIVGLVLDWIESEGGAAEIEKKNEIKAKVLYDAIDSSAGYYTGPIQKESRSRMNVTFRVAGGDEAVEKKFLSESAEEKLVGLSGHRSVGGLRVSLYNAVPKASVESLVAFMKEFQRRNG